MPFIPFPNNNTNTNDLKNIKPLIDVYDKVYSGFINDLDDIQELIFVLSGYGGTDFKRSMTSYISPGRWMDATFWSASGRIKRS